MKNSKNPAKVLIVDDDTNILEVLKIFLTEEGYEVSTLTSPENLAVKVAKISPAIILLDVLISGFNGLDTAKELKQNTKTKSIPLILMSGHSDLKLIVKESRADGFIEKPFDVYDLLKILDSSLSS